MVSRASAARGELAAGRQQMAFLAGLRGRALLCGLLVAIAALVVYRLTMLPDVGFWDTAEFQAVGPVLGIAHPTGYPAYTLLAWLASVVFQPFGNEAFRANLLSGVLAAGGAGIAAVTVTVLTRRLIAGIAAGGALAASPEAWAIGLHADPHALHLFLAALILFLLAVWSERVAAGRPADRWLVGASIVFGVSLANHALTFLLAPGIGLFVLLVARGIFRRPRLIAACVAAIAVTTLVLYAYLPLRSAMDPPLDYANPETWEGFRYLVFAEQFRGDFRALPDALSAMREVIGKTFEQLGLVAPLALVGLAVMAVRRPALAVLLATWFAVSWFFALGYINADIGRYHLVPLLSAAVLGGLGAGALLEAVSASVGRATERRSATAAVAALAAVLLVGPVLASVPARHDQLDESNATLARAWLTSVVERLPPDAVVISWWSYSTTLWYGQYVEDLRPDVTVIDDSTIVEQQLGDPSAAIDAHLGQRPVFLIRLPSDMAEFEARYDLEPVSGIVAGRIYRVEGPRTAALDADL